MTRLRKALLALAVVVVAFSMHTAEAADGVPAPAQQQQDAMGIDSMMPPPGIQDGNQPLLFEKHSALQYTPLEIDHGSQLKRGPVVGGLNEYFSAVASMETAMILAIGTVTTHLVEWSFSLDLVTALGGPVASVVNSLHGNLYDRYLYVALWLMGVWLAWQLLVRRRIMHAFGGLAWTAGVLALAMIFFADPVGYMGSANEFGNELGGVVLAGVSNYDPANGHDATTSSGSPQNAEVRLAANRLWESWVYDPWTVEQFGTVDPKVPGNNDQLGRELLKKKAKQPNNYDSDFQKMSQPVKDWTNGDNGAERMGYGFLALILAAAGAALVFMLALALLLAGVALLLLTTAAPLLFLFGLFPDVGHGLIRRWFEMVLGALLTKVVIGTFLSIVLVIDGALAGLTSQISWFLAALLQMLMLWAAWHLRGTILHAGRHMVHPQVSHRHTQHVRRTDRVSQTANQSLAYARSRIPGLPGQASAQAKGLPGAGATGKGGGDGQAGGGVLHAGPRTSTMRRIAADGSRGPTQEIGMAGRRAAAKRGAGAVAARQGAGAAAKTGAASSGTGAAAGTAAAGAATGGAALAALGGVKVAQGIIRLHDTARHGIQEHAGAALEGRHPRRMAASSSLPSRSTTAPGQDSILALGGRAVGRRVLERVIPPPLTPAQTERVTQARQATARQRPASRPTQQQGRQVATPARQPHRSEQRQVKPPTQQEQDIYDSVRKTFEDPPKDDKK